MLKRRERDSQDGFLSHSAPHRICALSGRIYMCTCTCVYKPFMYIGTLYNLQDISQEVRLTPREFYPNLEFQFTPGEGCGRYIHVYMYMYMLGTNLKPGPF